MARTQTTVVRSRRSGIALAAEQNGDTANGHYYLNSGKTLLLVRNANAGAQNVTIQVQGKVDGQSATDRVISIPAGETHVLGPYDVANYGSQVEVDVAHVDLKLRAIEPGTS